MSAADSRLRLLRLLPAALAVYELRYLLSAALHALRTVQIAALSLAAPSSWVLVISLALAAVLLREMSKGVTAGLTRPRWSAGFLLTWLACCAALLTLLAAGQLAAGGLHRTATVAGGLDHHLLPLLGAHGIAEALPGLLALSLILAASLQTVRWALRRARSGLRAAPAPAAQLERTGPPRPLFAAPPAPLLAGWSDRGPPAAGEIPAA